MRKYLNICFVILLVLPGVQFAFGVFPRFSLVDTPIVRKLPTLTIASLASATFQEKFEKWLIHNSGLFGWMIKTENSLNYNLFNIARSDYKSRTLLGKNKAIFDKIYLNDLNGHYLTKLPNLEDQVIKLKSLQDMMQENGKAFLLIIHPNKAVFNPQWVNDSQKIIPPNTRYLAKLRPFLDLYKINYLIIEDYFSPNIQYFVKSGAHLNSFGKCLSTKLVNDRLQELLPSADLPKFDCLLTGHSEAPKNEDLDLAKLLNVWDYTPSLEPVPSFNLQIQHLPKNKLKAMIAGTSYCFGLLTFLDQLHAFKAVDFIFYQKTHYFSHKKYTPNVNKGKKPFRPELHRAKFIKKHDILILESTDARLHQLGFGLLDSM